MLFVLISAQSERVIAMPVLMVDLSIVLSTAQMRAVLPFLNATLMPQRFISTFRIKYLILQEPNFIHINFIFILDIFLTSLFFCRV